LGEKSDGVLLELESLPPLLILLHEDLSEVLPLLRPWLLPPPLLTSLPEDDEGDDDPTYPDFPELLLELELPELEDPDELDPDPDDEDPPPLPPPPPPPLRFHIFFMSAKRPFSLLRASKTSACSRVMS
jgi:hypothetical protein